MSEELLVLGGPLVVRWNLHMNLNWYRRDMIPPLALDSSRAFMPKTLDMNERGKKIIVMIVNIMIARP
jgi:hypothetical protein